MAKNDTRFCFEAASQKLSAILVDHKEAKARGEACGPMLAAMASSIRRRAELDPTASRGETFERLTHAPQDE